MNGAPPPLPQEPTASITKPSVGAIVTYVVLTFFAAVVVTRFIAPKTALIGFSAFCVACFVFRRFRPADTTSHASRIAAVTKNYVVATIQAARSAGAAGDFAQLGRFFVLPRRSGGLGFVGLLVIFLSGFVLFSRSVHPVNETTRTATRAAWNALQQADFSARDIQRSSERFAKVALLYSQIDLTNVDSDLAAHVQASVGNAQRWGALSRAIEAEVAEHNSNAATITQLGQLFGTLVGDGKNVQHDAATGGIAFGSFAEIGRQSAIEDVLKNHKPQIDQLTAESQQLDRNDKALAQKLSERYMTPFTDAF